MPCLALVFTTLIRVWRKCVGAERVKLTAALWAAEEASKIRWGYLICTWKASRSWVEQEGRTEPTGECRR